MRKSIIFVHHEKITVVLTIKDDKFHGKSTHRGHAESIKVKNNCDILHHRRWIRSWPKVLTFEAREV